MGELHSCLVISIAYTVGESLELHQKPYIEKMLKKFLLEYVKPVSTPAIPNVTLQKDDGVSKAVNPVVYQSMIGSLLHAAVGTRRNNSHAVGIASKFSSTPCRSSFDCCQANLPLPKGKLGHYPKVRKVCICTANWIHWCRVCRWLGLPTFYNREKVSHEWWTGQLVL